MPRRHIILPTPPSYIKLLLAFGAGAGTKLYDKSRYHTHGTISGAAWATGLHGTCLSFNATTPDYVEITPTPSQLNFTSEGFSIVMRVYLHAQTNWSYLLARGLNNNDGYYLHNGADGSLDFATCQSGATQDTLCAAGTLTTNTWYTIGISRDGSSVKIYVNGVDVTATAGTHVNPTTCARTTKLMIHDNKSSSPTDGLVDFFAVFGVALTASEQLAWHNALA